MKWSWGADPRSPPRSAEPQRFLRLAQSQDGAVFELSTRAITLQRPSDGDGEEDSIVQLESVIHIADGGQYYGQMQQRLQECDRVLYELVLPRDGRILGADGGARPAAPPSPTAQQLFLARELGLVHQLQVICSSGGGSCAPLTSPPPARARVEP